MTDSRNTDPEMSRDAPDLRDAAQGRAPQARSGRRESILLALPRVLPFTVFIALLATEKFLVPVVEPHFDPRWLYAIRSAVTAVILIALWRHYIELRDVPRTGSAGWAAGVAAGVGVFLFWIVLDFSPLVIGEAKGYDPRVGGTMDWGLALTRLAGSALVVPVMEELFWRSFLMRWMEKARFIDVSPGNVGAGSLVMTSFVFALEHRLWFAGLLAGLIYGELYRRTGNLWVVIVAHAITNGLLGLYVLQTGRWDFW